MQRDTLDSAIVAVKQKIQDVKVEISRAESKAEEAEATGDAGELKYWRTKELQLTYKTLQLMEEALQLRDKKARRENLQQGMPFFLEGQPVNELSQSFVETESEAQLAMWIRSGGWCLVVGHRQSGKTSTVLAAQQILSASDPDLQLLHISLTRDYASSGELWQFLAGSLNSIDPLRFPVSDPAELAARPLGLVFQWNKPREGRAAVAIAIDGAAHLCSIENIVELMAELNAFRTEGRLLSLVLVGTEPVARLMEKLISITPTYFPFVTWNAEITPEPFTEAQICQLLSAYTEQSGVQLAPSTDDWAADVWQRTHGHRGLTSMCGGQLHALICASLLSSEGHVQLDKWRRYADNELPDVARKKPVISRMLADLQPSLQTSDSKEQILELLEMVLLEPVCFVPRSHPAVRLLLELGVARILPQPVTWACEDDLQQSATRWPKDAGRKDCLITVAAPLIKAILLADAAYELPNLPDSSDKVAPIKVLADAVQRRISVKQSPSAAQCLPWLGLKKAHRMTLPSVDRISSLKLPFVRLPNMQNVRW